MPGNTLLLYLVFFIGVVYFMLIRPQQKRQKHVQSLQESLKLGDLVVTIGGLHGVIVEMNERTLTIKSTDGSLLVFDREAIKYRSEEQRVDDKEDTLEFAENASDEIGEQEIETITTETDDDTESLNNDTDDDK